MPLDAGVSKGAGLDPELLQSLLQQTQVSCVEQEGWQRQPTALTRLSYRLYEGPSTFERDIRGC
jgi:hypothetical protein